MLRRLAMYTTKQTENQSIDVFFVVHKLTKNLTKKEFDLKKMPIHLCRERNE